MSERGLALFESWRGSYSDSPRALSEARPRHAALRPVWAAAGDTRFPTDVGVVRRHSPAYFAKLATARLVVSNDIISRHIVKGPRARYLQTWHGSPLKRIGFDESPTYAGAEAHMRRMRRDVAKWDYLITTSPVCTEIFREAFGFRGQVLETGLPRNDLLKAPNADQVRRRVRSELGIPDSTTAVLYAPTWRDDRNVEGGGFSQEPGIDAGLLRSALPQTTVLLTRIHRNVVRPPSYGAPGFVRDVSAHPSVEELYLAADVFVSDYSSGIYDFAVTGKPIVLFAYDLEHYARSVRGLYFDYADWAPGPVVETSSELARVLVEIMGRSTTRPDDTYAAFIAKFCPWDDGQASSRVWDALLADEGA
jgi:CDP-glycerol glycerophosphotransferase